MLKKLDEIQKQAFEDLKTIKDLDSLLSLQKKYLGRKGPMSQVFKELKSVADDQRKNIGQYAQSVFKEIDDAINGLHDTLSGTAGAKKNAPGFIDYSAQGTKLKRGHLHPLTHILQKSQDVFLSMGFEVISGPEVESQEYNFDLLNFPRDHPARDMQDTFYLESEVRRENDTLKLHDEMVLRTHTSPVQVRSMLTRKPPVRLVVPGRTFRYEAIDASHEATFHQLEGLVIDTDISVRHLISTLKQFFCAMFETEVQIRVRPSYFPFVEPGVEVDMTCFICEQRGCSVCKRTGWLEMGGAGMVHPNVLRNMKVDPEVYNGFAFGMGLDRLMMLYYGIDDIRMTFSGDMRFLEQF